MESLSAGKHKRLDLHLSPASPVQFHLFSRMSEIYLVPCQGDEKIKQSPVQDYCNTKYEFFGNAENINLGQKKRHRLAS